MLDPKSIISDNCISAWKDACQYMLNNGDGFNLVVQITNPLNFEDVDLENMSNAGLLPMYDVRNVINTIFPYKLYRKRSWIPVKEFYDSHEKIYLRGKSMHSKNKSRWGNYFLRFTRFGEQSKNQLQNIINHINSRDNQYSACYIMHVSSMDTDNNTRNMGGPCLQYVQFGQFNDALHLTAVYRNHDFYSKALGNYIGLSRLLEFVCEQTDMDMGSVTCYSIHYYLDHRKQVADSFNTSTS